MLLRSVFVLAIAGFTASISAFTVAGQITIGDSPFLYKSAENYSDSFFDTSVNDTAHNRMIAIRIRYPLGTTGQLPLVMWSHGGGPDDNGRVQSETWGRTMAKAGYIIVHLSHPGWTVAEQAGVCQEFGVNTPAECANMPVMSVYRARDANAVLAALNTLEQTNPQISGRIDRNNIAVAGWSYGSFAPIALAGARLRFSNTFNDVTFSNPLPKVFLAMSPAGPGIFGLKEDSWREIFRPVLMATGPADDGGIEVAPNRLFVFPAMPPGKKYQLYIRHPDTIHATFNLENDDHPEFSQWLASYALAYLDANLKDRADGKNFLISNRLPTYGSKKTAVISRK